MKTLLNKLTKGRITRWGFLAVLLIAAGATVAAKHQRQYQLGGSFIGTSPGLVWNAVQTPLDPDGRTGALVVKSAEYDAATAGLLAFFGADTLTEGVGGNRMISRDTATVSLIAYAQAGGKALGEALEIKAILVYAGTMQFTSPDDMVLNYEIKVYPATADVSPHDGFPDDGATPTFTIPGVPAAGKRVPIP